MSVWFLVIVAGFAVGASPSLGSGHAPMDHLKYDLAATPEQVQSFLAENGDLYALPEMMAPGKIVQVRLGDDASGKSLPSRPDATGGVPPLPIKMPEGDVDVDDDQAFKATVRSCDQKQQGSSGEEIICVTSLEAMGSFVESKVGKEAKALATTPAPSTKVNFIIKEKTMVVDYGAAPLVVCHSQAFPFPVKSCHRVEKSAVYGVSLVHLSDGQPVEAIVVCHKDTRSWSPEHVSFQVLPGDVKPGIVTPVCHYLFDSDLLWQGRPLG